MFSSDATAEEIRQFDQLEYEGDKKGLMEYYHQLGGKKSGLKKFLIDGLIRPLNPVASLERIKSDSKLKLTNAEWEYARKIAFERLKKLMIEEYAATDEEMNSDETKEYFKSLGFADFLEV